MVYITQKFLVYILKDIHKLSLMNVKIFEQCYDGANVIPDNAVSKQKYIIMCVHIIMHIDLTVFLVVCNNANSAIQFLF